MSRRLPTLVVPGAGAMLPVNDIAAPEWTAAKGQAQRADSRVFDVRAFPTHQAAIDAAGAAGGGEVFFAEPPPDGLDLVLHNNVYLVGRGSGATSFTVRTITGSGSLVALPALAASVPLHSRIVTFAADPGLVPGDVFVLGDSADASFNTARPTYRAGEFCRVDGVSGTTVTLTKPTYAAYSSGSTVTAAKVVPIRTGVSGMTIRCTTGQTGIRIDLGTDLVFRDLVMRGSDISHLTLSRCYHFDITGFKAFDAQPATTPAGLNYGISLLNCQRGVIAFADLETRRHGLTMGGDNVPYGVPNRDIDVVGGSISGMSDVPGVCGCNLHGNCEDIRFNGVKMPAGLNPGGDRIAVRNCDIGSAAWGGAIGSMELLGPSLTFTNNTIRANANHDSNRGLVYILMESYTTRRGHLIFTDNTVDLRSYVGTGAATVGLHVLVNHTAVSTQSVAEIKRNRFLANPLPAGTAYGARVRTAVANPGFVEAQVEDNTGNLPVVVEAVTPRFIGSGAGAPTFAAAKGSVYRRTDGGAGTTMYVNETGTATWTAK